MLVSEAPEPLIAEIERIAPRAWRLPSILGKDNRPASGDVSSDLKVALSRGMQAAGYTLLDDHPFYDLDAVVGFGTARDEDPRWLEG